jgi:N utilization substance protein B
MASNRHMSRIAVVQALFAWEFRGGDPKTIYSFVVEEFYPKLSSIEFGLSNMEGILKEREKIKEIITELAPQWEFDKIAPVDRVILEQGIYEIVFSDEVPPVVAINEAIEIAKEFGQEKSSKFINGVLSNTMKKYKPKETKKSSKDPKK